MRPLRVANIAPTGTNRPEAPTCDLKAVAILPTVFAPPGEWHWHGAAPDHFMTHIAMWEAPAEGAESDWGAYVTDAEYLGQTGRGRVV